MHDCEYKLKSWTLWCHHITCSLCVSNTIILDMPCILDISIGDHIPHMSEDNWV